MGTTLVMPRQPKANLHNAPAQLLPEQNSSPALPDVVNFRKNYFFTGDQIRGHGAEGNFCLINVYIGRKKLISD